MAQPTPAAPNQEQLLTSLLGQLNGTSNMAAASLNLSPQQLQLLTSVDPNIVAQLLTAADPGRARYLAHALGSTLQPTSEPMQQASLLTMPFQPMQVSHESCLESLGLAAACND